MRKFLKKIICVCAATVMTTGLFAASACDGVYSSTALKGDISKGTVVSNGGFAVEKGDYIYYINGKQTNTADNTFGSVETGAIKRISKTDLAARNYGNAETVVPEIVHSGNNNGGLFIYGDYVYYSTPSSEKNSDGEIQNSTIQFKSAKLDGTNVMKSYYAQYTDNSIEYRFVEEGGVVYLLYVAKSENLYGTAYTNLHSVNTNTGKDTLLAYNVGSVIFDSKDVTNPRVYYTMSVTDFDNNKSFSNYNQIYTVKADATTPNEYDFSKVTDYDAEKDPLYVNCGTLVYDGIGRADAIDNLTQFNAPELKDKTTLDSFDGLSYTYTLSDYENGWLFYTRTSNKDSGTASLFAESEDNLLAASHKPATENTDKKYLLVDGSNASDYTYLFDDNKKLTGALISDDDGLIKTKVDENGKLLTKVDVADPTFYVHAADGKKPTVLFTQKHDDGNYVYYSLSGSGAKGYVIYRVCYDGDYNDYNGMSASTEVTVGKHTPVRILDLDSSSDWYLPEMFDGRIFFSTQTKNMTEYSSDTTNYSHIMVCDINGASKVMTNDELYALNKQYEKITETIDGVDETTYENLKNAYNYVYYTGDVSEIDTIINAYVDIGEDKEKFWSEETVAKINSFLTPAADNDWKDFKDLKLTVNGKEIYANRHDYYYALLGTMTAAQKEAYDNYLRTTYLQDLPEEEEGWFESLSAGAKAGFLIGVIGGGLVLIAAGVVVALIIIRKRKSKLPVYTKTRIKVDTTDDKSVDVYATDETENAQEDNKE